MKFVRAGVAFALVLGVFGLLLTWQATGQAPAPRYPVVGQALDGHSVTWGFPSRDPEMDKLHSSEAAAAQEVSKLMAEYAKTEKEEERAKVKTKLGAALEKQFDAQQKRRELELTRLEAKLKKVRELMKKRSEERKVIIDKRLDQLVREAEGLGWAPPPGPRSGFGGLGNFGQARPKMP